MSALFLIGALIASPGSAVQSEPSSAPANAAPVQPGLPIASDPSAAPSTAPDVTQDAPPAPVEATPHKRHGHEPEPPVGPDVVVKGLDNWQAPDPMRGVNEQSFKATEAVDRAFVGPVAMAYKKTLPSPVRQGIHNFLYNFREPVVFFNFVLQLKIGKAAETAARFAINSTVGVAGVMDIAKRKPFKLPRRGNGFADTLGFYGVKPGPFMFLPIVGPTTVRDLFGGAIDRLILPFTYGRRITKPAFVVPFAVLGALDHRSEFDDTLHILHDGQADPYARSRDFYLQRRQAEIDELKGRGARNSSPMSVAPTGPIKVRERAPAPGVPSADAPIVAAPDAIPFVDPGPPPRN